MTDENKEVQPICLLAPTKVLAEMAQKIIAAENMPISVYVAALDKAVEIARKQEKKGTWLFISRKGTKTAIEDQLGVKAISIALDASDYIPAMTQARKDAGLIAIFYYEDISNDLETICYLLNIKIKCYQFKTDREADEVVQQAIADGATFGIGGAVTDYYAKQYKLKHVIVESSSEEGVISADMVQQKLKSLIEAEDKAHPLSDDILSKQLSARGFNISRRTVAKYRDILHIASSSKRKK